MKKYIITILVLMATVFVTYFIMGNKSQDNNNEKNSMKIIKVNPWKTEYLSISRPKDN